MSISFADFRPVGLAFEVRYPDSFLLWDRAGQIARELQARYSISRLTSAEPGKIVFVYKRTYELTWQLDRLIVVDHRPATPIDEFYRVCEDCFNIAVDVLEISELKRVGFRPGFAKKFASRQDAAAALLATDVIHIPEGKQFNVEALQTFPEYAVRHEGEKFGYSLKISVQSVKYEFEPPPQWEAVDLKLTDEHRIMFDVDWFTLAPMPVGAMSVTDWLSQIMHAIRRDADRYLKG